MTTGPNRQSSTVDGCWLAGCWLLAAVRTAGWRTLRCWLSFAHRLFFLQKSGRRIFHLPIYRLRLYSHTDLTPTAVTVEMLQKMNSACDRREVMSMHAWSLGCMLRAVRIY
eukprot:SAG25_NODE_329_length_9697_cov_22.376120_5_plen_111_part_00